MSQTLSSCASFSIVIREGNKHTGGGRRKSWPVYREELFVIHQAWYIVYTVKKNCYFDGVLVAEDSREKADAH